VGRNSTLSKRTQRLAEENLANARKTANSATKAARSGWHDITDAFDGAVDRSQHLAGDAKSRLGEAKDEGLRRTMLAKDALAGKRPPKRRPWVAGTAALLGAAFGALGAVYARRVAKAREQAQAEDAAAAVAADLAYHDSGHSRINGSGPSGTYMAKGSSPSAATAKVTTPRTNSEPTATPKSTDL
jgi:hypothetical protein